MVHDVRERRAGDISAHRASGDPVNSTWQRKMDKKSQCCPSSDQNIERCICRTKFEQKVGASLKSSPSGSRPCSVTNFSVQSFITCSCNRSSRCLTTFLLRSPPPQSHKTRKRHRQNLRIIHRRALEKVAETFDRNAREKPTSCKCGPLEHRPPVHSFGSAQNPPSARGSSFAKPAHHHVEVGGAAELTAIKRGQLGSHNFAEI